MSRTSGKGGGELEPPRLSVYKDIGSKRPGAAGEEEFRRVRCRLRSPSNSLQKIDFKAEVVELADTPSATASLDLPGNLLTKKQIAYSSFTYVSA